MEKRKTSSIPPSLVALKKGQYLPVNPPILGFMQDFGRTFHPHYPIISKYFDFAHSVNVRPQIGCGEDVLLLLDQMPVWKELDDRCQLAIFDQIQRYIEKHYFELDETKLIELVLRLAADYELVNEIMVDVEDDVMSAFSEEFSLEPPTRPE
jgi:hypothetical protein